MDYEYQIENINEHFYRIVDCCKTACYLVVGKNKAILLDCCDGLGHLREVVESITKLPITLVLTHGHLDHAGGASQFADSDIYMNLKDKVIYPKNGEDEIETRVDYAHRCGAKDAKREDFTPYYQGTMQDLSEKTVFDLGGITVRFVSVPGHTPGMMCPLIIEDRSIIFGDACGVAVMLLDEHSSTVGEYKKSLEHLKTYEDQYDDVYRNHGSYSSHKDILENVIECCTNILAHKDDHVPNNILGYEGFMAKQIKPNSQIPVDGKEGNIFYIESKVK